jgi:hypothetical protein
MTTFPNAPRILKGGLVLVDPGSQLPQRIIVLQINPETLSRTVQVQAAGGEGSADRMLPLRLKAPPVETIKLDAQIARISARWRSLLSRRRSRCSCGASIASCRCASPSSA